jgi:hypothetical protein
VLNAFLLQVRNKPFTPSEFGVLGVLFLRRDGNFNSLFISFYNLVIAAKEVAIIP